MLVNPESFAFMRAAGDAGSSDDVRARRQNAELGRRDDRDGGDHKQPQHDEEPPTGAPRLSRPLPGGSRSCTTAPPNSPLFVSCQCARNARASASEPSGTSCGWLGNDFQMTDWPTVRAFATKSRLRMSRAASASPHVTRPGTPLIRTDGSWNTPCRSAHFAQPITLDTSLLPAQFRPPKITSVRHGRPFIALYPSGTRYHTFGAGLCVARVRTATFVTKAGAACNFTTQHISPSTNGDRIHPPPLTVKNLV